ncbi:MAG: hypothetical protein JF625_16840 [Inquilinus limosus]|uniref:Secreted protein n=1 Tax=Inquilinus limosus TaxID=171674 RepID=A0A952FR71_9PROT|nr:hypothetical protein [Inquilinus limosus]
MRTVSIVVGAAILAGMIGCTARSPAPPSMSLEALWKIHDPEACKKVGGEWGPTGMTGTPACTVPLPDAGKSCTDKHECIGLCVAEIDSRYNGVGIEDFKPARGQCQAESHQFGCFIEFRDGKRRPAICVD